MHNPTQTVLLLSLDDPFQRGGRYDRIEFDI